MAFTAQTDRQILKLSQSGQIASTQNGMAVDPLTPKTGAVAAAHTKYYAFPVNMADSAGLTVALPESLIAQMQVAGKVVSVTFSTPVAVTANNANFATWTLAKRTGAGGALTIATQSTAITGMNSLVAFVPYTAVQTDFTAANTNVAAGDVLTLTITKSGAGIALTAGTAALPLSALVVTVGIEEN